MSRIAGPKKIAEAASSSAITIMATKWRDSYGNTYHRVRIYLNGMLIATSGVEYGYGDVYMDTAADLLAESGVVPGATYPGLRDQIADAGYVLVEEDEGYVKRKKDL